MKEYISLEDYITASGTYPERLKSSELTDEIKNNAKKLIEKINQLLTDLNWGNVKVSSGFRPSTVNSQISNAAKKSLHMTGNAVDIEDDKKQSLAQTIQKKEETTPGFLKKYGLWLENPKATIGKNTNWCHLDNKDRGLRSLNIFNP